MTKDNHITEVIFRKFKDGGDVIALFPYDIYNNRGGINSYMHLGQHSEAEYSACVTNSKPAQPYEYADLFAELESIGYNLKVIKKHNLEKYLKAYRLEQLKYK